MNYKLVPTEPTDDMIVAFAEAWYSKRQCIDDPDMLDAYRDMLAVAPQPGRADEICAFNNWYIKNRGVLGQPGYKEDFQVWMARAQSGGEP